MNTLAHSSLLAELLSEWKVIGTVSLVCAGIGWTAAATNTTNVDSAPVLVQPEIVSLPHTSTVAVVPVPEAISSEKLHARELARLKTRNRRLEALIRDMRDREIEYNGAAQLP